MLALVEGPMNQLRAIPDQCHRRYLETYHAVTEYTQTLYYNCQLRVHATAHKIAEKLSIVPYVATAALFFTASSSPFILGVFASAITPETMNSSINRISAVWGRQNFIVHCILVAGMISAWPMSLVLTSFFMGAHSSLRLQEYSQQAQAPQQDAAQAQDLQQDAANV